MDVAKAERDERRRLRRERLGLAPNNKPDAPKHVPPPALRTVLEKAGVADAAPDPRSLAPGKEQPSAMAMMGKLKAMQDKREQRAAKFGLVDSTSAPPNEATKVAGGGLDIGISSELNDEISRARARAEKFGIIENEAGAVAEMAEQYPTHFKLMESHNSNLQKEVENLTKRLAEAQIQAVQALSAAKSHQHNAESQRLEVEALSKKLAHAEIQMQEVRRNPTPLGNITNVVPPSKQDIEVAKKEAEAAAYARFTQDLSAMVQERRDLDSDHVPIAKVVEFQSSVQEIKAEVDQRLEQLAVARDTQQSAKEEESLLMSQDNANLVRANADSVAESAAAAATASGKDAGSALILLQEEVKKLQAENHTLKTTVQDVTAAQAQEKIDHEAANRELQLATQAQEAWLSEKLELEAANRALTVEMNTIKEVTAHIPRPEGAAAQPWQSQATEWAHEKSALQSQVEALRGKLEVAEVGLETAQLEMQHLQHSHELASIRAKLADSSEPSHGKAARLLPENAAAKQVDDGNNQSDLELEARMMELESEQKRVESRLKRLASATLLRQAENMQKQENASAQARVESVAGDVKADTETAAGAPAHLANDDPKLLPNSTTTAPDDNAERDVISELENGSREHDHGVPEDNADNAHYQEDDFEVDATQAEAGDGEVLENQDAGPAEHANKTKDDQASKTLEEKSSSAVEQDSSPPPLDSFNAPTDDEKKHSAAEPDTAHVPMDSTALSSEHGKTNSSVVQDTSQLPLDTIAARADEEMHSVVEPDTTQQSMAPPEAPTADEKTNSNMEQNTSQPLLVSTDAPMEHDKVHSTVEPNTTLVPLDSTATLSDNGKTNSSTVQDTSPVPLDSIDAQADDEEVHSTVEPDATLLPLDSTARSSDNGRAGLSVEETAPQPPLASADAPADSTNPKEEQLNMVSTPPKTFKEVAQSLVGPAPAVEVMRSLKLAEARIAELEQEVEAARAGQVHTRALVERGAAAEAENKRLRELVEGREVKQSTSQQDQGPAITAQENESEQVAALKRTVHEIQNELEEMRSASTTRSPPPRLGDADGEGSSTAPGALAKFSAAAWLTRLRIKDAHAAYKDATISRLEREVEKFKVLARVAGDKAKAGLNHVAGSLGSSFDASSPNAAQQSVEAPLDILAATALLQDKTAELAEAQSTNQALEDENVALRRDATNAHMHMSLADLEVQRLHVQSELNALHFQTENDMPWFGWAHNGTSDEEMDNSGKVEARMKELQTDLKSLDEQIATAEAELAKEAKQKNTDRIFPEIAGGTQVVALKILLRVKDERIAALERSYQDALDKAKAAAGHAKSPAQAPIVHPQTHPLLELEEEDGEQEHVEALAAADELINYNPGDEFLKIDNVNVLRTRLRTCVSMLHHLQDQTKRESEASQREVLRLQAELSTRDREVASLHIHLADTHTRLLGQQIRLTTAAQSAVRSLNSQHTQDQEERNIQKDEAVNEAEQKVHTTIIHRTLAPAHCLPGVRPAVARVHLKHTSSVKSQRLEQQSVQGMAARMRSKLHRAMADLAHTLREGDRTGIREQARIQSELGRLAAMLQDLEAVVKSQHEAVERELGQGLAYSDRKHPAPEAVLRVRISAEELDALVLRLKRIEGGAAAKYPLIAAAQELEVITSNRHDTNILVRVMATQAPTHLLSILRYGPKSAIRPASSVLAHLARLKKHRPVLGRYRVVETLADRLVIEITEVAQLAGPSHVEDHDRAEKFDALGAAILDALINLCALCDDNRTRLLQHNVLPCLVELMQRNVAKVKNLPVLNPALLDPRPMILLRSLLMSKDLPVKELVPTTVLPGLAFMLSARDNEKVVLNAIWVLSNLTFDASTDSSILWREHIREAGCLPDIINFLSPGYKVDIVHAAAAAIGNLVWESLENQQAACELGAVSMLERIAGTNNWASYHRADSQRCAKKALSALRNIYGPSQLSALDLLESHLQTLPVQEQHEAWARIERAIHLEDSEVQIQ